MALITTIFSRGRMKDTSLAINRFCLTLVCLLPLFRSPAQAQLVPLINGCQAVISETPLYRMLYSVASHGTHLVDAWAAKVGLSDDGSGKQRDLRAIRFSYRDRFQERRFGPSDHGLARNLLNEMFSPKRPVRAVVFENLVDETVEWTGPVILGRDDLRLISLIGEPLWPWLSDPKNQPTWENRLGMSLEFKAMTNEKKVIHRSLRGIETVIFSLEQLLFGGNGKSMPEGAGLYSTNLKSFARESVKWSVKRGKIPSQEPETSSSKVSADESFVVKGFQVFGEKAARSSRLTDEMTVYGEGGIPLSKPKSTAMQVIALLSFYFEMPLVVSADGSYSISFSVVGGKRVELKGRPGQFDNGEIELNGNIIDPLSNFSRFVDWMTRKEEAEFDPKKGEHDILGPQELASAAGEYRPDLRVLSVGAGEGVVEGAIASIPRKQPLVVLEPILRREIPGIDWRRIVLAPSGVQEGVGLSGPGLKVFTPEALAKELGEFDRIIWVNPDIHFARGDFHEIADRTFGPRAVQFMNSNIDEFRAVIRESLELYLKRPDTPPGRGEIGHNSWYDSVPVQVGRRTWTPEEVARQLENITDLMFTSSTRLDFEFNLAQMYSLVERSLPLLSEKGEIHLVTEWLHAFMISKSDGEGGTSKTGIAIQRLEDLLTEKIGRELRVQIVSDPNLKEVLWPPNIDGLQPFGRGAVRGYRITRVK